MTDAAPPSRDRRFWWATVAYLIALTPSLVFGRPLWEVIASAALYVAAVAAVVVRRRHRLALSLVAAVATPVGSGSLWFPALLCLGIRPRDRATSAIAAGSAVSMGLSTFGRRVIEVGLDTTEVATRTELASALAQWAIALLMGGLALVAGRLIGTRRELLESLQDRAERAEAERSLRAREAVLLERNRIAGEMHDVLGHKLSLLTLQAGALEVNPTDAEAVERSAVQIRTTARAALDDLRDVIGALRTDDDAPLTPTADLGDVLTLLQKSRDAGAHVTLEDSLTDAKGLEPAVGRAVHRIVQESLANAHHHAPGEHIHVCLAGVPGRGVTVEIENGIPPGGSVNPGNGTGLDGLAERVRLAGGTFTAGPSGDRFRVHARLPWDAEGSQP